VNSGEVQVFGVEIAIRNRDLEFMDMLWNANYMGMWEGQQLVRVARLVVRTGWAAGLKAFLESFNTRQTFSTLSAEEKENFLGKELLFLALGQKNSELIEVLKQALRLNPYVEYALLMFPLFFHNNGALDACLTKINDECVKHFFYQRGQPALEELHAFVHIHSPNLPKALLHARDLALKLLNTDLRPDLVFKKLTDLPQIIRLIKAGDIEGLDRFMKTIANAQLFDSFSQTEKELISKVNFIYGVEDKETTHELKQILKTEEDVSIRLLFAGASTYTWNPLTYAIFYKQIDLV